MKLLKKIITILVVIAVVLPILTYVGIVITNNVIADKIEKELVKYDLPSSTELIDSISLAGKLSGNGNGMQYMGAILIKSDLSETQLKSHYSDEFDNVVIDKQTSADIDSIRPGYRFNKFPESSGNYYSVICWDSDREELGEFICNLLDFDIRGH